jgi:hypothetical protein
MDSKIDFPKDPRAANRRPSLSTPLSHLPVFILGTERKRIRVFVL